jgi:hypothetical protein
MTQIELVSLRAPVKRKGELDLGHEAEGYVYEWIRMRQRRMEEDKKRKKIKERMKRLTKPEKK